MKILIAWTSLILAVSLFAEVGDNKGQLKRSMKVVPLPSTYLSIENGGTNHASAALSDGIGIYTTQEDEYARAIAYLNGKYGDDALKDETSLKDYVLDNGTTADKELAEKLVNGPAKSVINEPCDDGNPQTENDIYLDENFTCQGVLTRNESKCSGDATGSEFLVNGVYHLVVDNNTIKNNLNRAETLCTSKVTNMSNLFKNNKTFNSDISKWDTSNVTNMSAMFESAISFNQPIGDWDTSKVTNMSDMFSNLAGAAASAFNQDIGGWDTSNVTDMGFMFHRAEKFKEPLNNWNVSNVTRMYGMFYKAYGFNQALDKWNVKKVTDMRYMFQNATSFNQDLSGWCVSQVTTPNRNLFNSNTPSWDKPKPIWGSCPQTP